MLYFSFVVRLHQISNELQENKRFERDEVVQVSNYNKATRR